MNNKLILKYLDGGNWVEKYYNPILNKGFEFLKEYPATFIDKYIYEPTIGIHPSNFILNRLQRKFTNTDAPAIIRTQPSYMIYDYINEKTTKLNNQPNLVKKQSTKPNSQINHKLQLKLNKYTPLIVNKLGGVLFGRKGFKVIDGQLNIIADSGNYLPILLGENGGYKYIGSDGKEHYFNTFTPWDKAQLHKIGYTVDNNKIIKLQNTGNETQSVAPVDTSNPVQSNISTSFTPEQFLLALLGNDEYIKRFKQLLGIQENQVKPDETLTGVKPEPEATKTEVTTPTAPTYESLRDANTVALNNNINSRYFRKLLGRALNDAMLNGTIYGANNPNGTQVFDSLAIVGYKPNGEPVYADAAYIMNTYGKDGEISRRDMRMLRKDIIRNLNLARINNINKFLGITSPAVASPSVSPAAELVVSTLPVNNNVYDPTGKFKAVQDGTYGSGGYDPLKDESIKSKNQFAT